LSLIYDTECDSSFLSSGIITRRDGTFSIPNVNLDVPATTKSGFPTRQRGTHRLPFRPKHAAAFRHHLPKEGEFRSLTI
jgi:hypothetical protein